MDSLGSSPVHCIRVTCNDEVTTTTMSENDVKRKRKREKLDHLTEEEKLIRRKIKNRISAQTSRDKKKCVMNTYEIQLASMSEANRELQEENVALKKKLETCESNQIRVSLLEMENKLLMERLEMLETMIHRTTDSPAISEIYSLESKSERSVDTSFEPAAPINGSQQKNQEVKTEISMILITILIISLIVMVKTLIPLYHPSPINYWKTKVDNYHFFPGFINSNLITKSSSSSSLPYGNLVPMAVACFLNLVSRPSSNLHHHNKPII